MVVVGNGRSDRTRTCDLTLPKRARYQLRYTPFFGEEKKVSPLGLEPRTHSLKGCRSNRLSYGPSREGYYIIKKRFLVIYLARWRRNWQESRG